MATRHLGSRAVLLLVILFFTISCLECQVFAAGCRGKTPIRIAQLDWDSGAFGAALVSELLEQGYGCSTQLKAGGTLEQVENLIRGRVDVVTEVWEADAPPTWAEAEKLIQVVKLGRGYTTTQQGWFIPKYVVEGPSALAPHLKSVSDLSALKHLFAIPSRPERSRFYNCPLGTECQIVNTKKLRAYGLDGIFTDYLPSSQASLESAIVFALHNKKPILFYYWEPSSLINKTGIGRDAFVRLKEPPYEPAVWSSLLHEINPAAACAFPPTEITVAGNGAFVTEHPDISLMLKKLNLGVDEILRAELQMRNEGLSPKTAALRFLREHREVWISWVSPIAAVKLSESLRKSKAQGIPK